MTTNEYIASLKVNGKSLIQTIIFVKHKYEISLKEAKVHVLKSPSWIDHEATFNTFRDEFVKVMIIEADVINFYEDETKFTFKLNNNKSVE